jgi:hypothetical protein
MLSLVILHLRDEGVKTLTIDGCSEDLNNAENYSRISLSSKLHRNKPTGSNNNKKIIIYHS